MAKTQIASTAADLLAECNQTIKNSEYHYRLIRPSADSGRCLVQLFGADGWSKKLPQTVASVLGQG